MTDTTERRGTRLPYVIASPRALASNTAHVSTCLLEALRPEHDSLEVTTLDLFRADLMTRPQVLVA